MTVLEPPIDTIARDANGLPILGARDPQREAQARLQALAQEKQNLAPDDHDWAIVVRYAVMTADSHRIVESQKTGVSADPPIQLTNANMAGEPIGPVCLRCDQHFEEMGETPCPGMTFAEYLGRLDPDARDEVLRRMEEQRRENDKRQQVAEAVGVVEPEASPSDPAA